MFYILKGDRYFWVPANRSFDILHSQMFYLHWLKKFQENFQGQTLWTFIYREAAVQTCSLKKVFWKYAANLQENTHAEVQMQSSFIEITLRQGFFSCKFAAYFQSTFSYEKLLVTASIYRTDALSMRFCLKLQARGRSFSNPLKLRNSAHFLT